MLIIGCMDGASGSIRDRRHRTRKYMSNTVFEELGRNNIETFKYFEGKGGIWRRWDRKLDKFIHEHNETGNTLILIGKSYGGRDVKDALVRLFKKDMDIKYDEIRVLFVDAEWMFRRTETKMEVPAVDWIINVYQRNTRVLNGAPVESPSTKKLEQYIMEDENVDHFNIVRTDLVRQLLRKLIR